MSDKVCLKWSDFQTNVVKTFQSLRGGESYSDVTLVCEDMKLIMAHKVALSSCSQYFENIFKNNNMPCSNLVLCLPDTTSVELQMIMDYIYQGEVKIKQLNLQKFLAVANRLKLDGLMMTKSEFVDGPEEQLDIDEYAFVLQEAIDTEAEKSKALHSIELNNANEESENGNDYEEDEIKIENQSQHNNSKHLTLPENSTLEDIDKIILESIGRTDKGFWICKLCGKSQTNLRSGKNLTDMKKHVEWHLPGKPFTCKICEKNYSTRHTLTGHLKKQHNETSFSLSSNEFITFNSK